MSDPLINSPITDVLAPPSTSLDEDMSTRQAPGLSPSADGYFAADSKVALAAQAVLLKQMSDHPAEGDQLAATEDRLEILSTDVLLGAAVPTAGEAASSAADPLDPATGR